MKYERAGTPIRLDGVTITPIAEVRLDATRWRHGLYVWGSVEPVAVLVRSDGEETRVEITGRREGGTERGTDRSE